MEAKAKEELSSNDLTWDLSAQSVEVITLMFNGARPRLPTTIPSTRTIQLTKRELVCGESTGSLSVAEEAIQRPATDKS